MTQWVLISRELHAKARYRPAQGYAHAAAFSFAPVLLRELPRLLPHYVLAFVAAGERYRPVALLGGQDNAYLGGDGQWLAPYVPAVLRAHPFGLHDQPVGTATQTSAALAIDAAHLSEQAGERLLTDAGELSAKVAQTAQFLLHCRRDLVNTDAAADALAQRGLLVPWQLQLPDGKGGTVALEGLWRVDEAALNRLDDGSFGALRGAALALAHAQWFGSANQTAFSQHLAARRAAAPAQPNGVAEVDFDQLFGEGQGDDRIRFDFG